jgi:hypothetical protein
MTAPTIGSDLTLLPLVPAGLQPRGLRVRRAGLLDVPAVARLIETGLAGDPGHDGHGLPAATLGAAARLVLTHVGLEYGEFWVAVDDADEVRAAVVLLPPREHEDGASIGDGVEMAFRLQLGLSSEQLPDLAGEAGVAGTEWMLLALAAPGLEPVLDDLLAAGLPAGLSPVALLRPGMPEPPALAG